MARRRRGRKGHGRKGGKAIPLLMLAPVIPGFAAAWDNRATGPKNIVRQGVVAVSGVDILGEVPIQMDKVYRTLGMVIVGMIGHKIANKTGINRQLKKVSMGYIQL